MPLQMADVLRVLPCLRYVQMDSTTSGVYLPSLPAVFFSTGAFAFGLALAGAFGFALAGALVFGLVCFTF